MPRRRRSRAQRGFNLFLTILLLVALGPSAVGMARATAACRLWESAKETEPSPGDETMRAVTNQYPDYQRAEDQTYLTLPEWYIVYSADEYGAFLRSNSSSDFPYFGAVQQYWQSYVDVCNQVRGRYPRNNSYQFVLGFIGVSFTAENMLKGTYEATLGRAASWLGPDELTEEEVYAANVAQEYGAFLHNTPWYFFPFGEKLQGLWNETSYWGPGPVRKWERKLALSVEYGIKALYGGLTRSGSAATYGGPDESKIYAVVKGASAEMQSADFEIIQAVDEERDLVYLTRFEVFSTLAPGWMREGLAFVEIAGNDELLITTLGAVDANHQFEHGEYLFDLPILTEPGRTRSAFKVRVQELHLFLDELSTRNDITFEHIYDY